MIASADGHPPSTDTAKLNKQIKRKNNWSITDRVKDKLPTPTTTASPTPNTPKLSTHHNHYEESSVNRPTLVDFGSLYTSNQTE